MLYLIALFLHVIGALLYSASLAIEWLCQFRLRKAETSDKFNEWFAAYSKLPIISGIAWLLLLVPGIYLMVVIWNNAAWANIAMAGFFLLIIIGSLINGTRMKPLIKEIKSSGYTSAIRNKLDDQMINFSLKARTTLTIGIVFLMTVKPGLSDSIITLIISLLLGFLPVNLSKSEKTAGEL